MLLLEVRLLHSELFHHESQCTSGGGGALCPMFYFSSSETALLLYRSFRRCSWRWRIEDDTGLDIGRHRRRIGLGPSCFSCLKCNENPPCLYEIHHVYMKSGLICTNFIRFVEKEFEMYVADTSILNHAFISIFIAL